MACGHPKDFTIGVVEWDDSVRRALDRLFRAEGWTVCAFSGEEPFAEIQAACREHPLACLVVDVGGPRVARGLDVASLRDFSGVCPIVAISAQEDDATRDRARSIGSSAFFRKPVDDQALLDAVRWAAALHN